MNDSEGLLKTALHDLHVQAGARMVEFAGWSMPLLYSGILDEHARTRKDATVFDVSHMGRIKIRGDRAFKLLDKACTADVLGQQDNTARYSLLCRDDGGILDDIFVFRFEEHWLVVCNASNRTKVHDHLRTLNEQGGFGAKIEDQTLSTCMLAVQGPRAVEKLAKALPFDITGVGRHQVLSGSYMVFKYIASRSGYTGEDGFEVILPNMAGPLAWKYITSEKGGVSPAGLGSRDVLRLEAGLPLYGHELNETVNPLAAGLDRAVRISGDYVGAVALAAVRQKGPARRLVGLRLGDRRIARQGTLLRVDDWEVGVVTSGTFSPSCDASIAMAYVDRQFADVGQKLLVQIRPNEDVAAEVVSLPFYRGSGFKRS